MSVVVLAEQKESTLHLRMYVQKANHSEHVPTSYKE